MKGQLPERDESSEDYCFGYIKIQSCSVYIGVGSIAKIIKQITQTFEENELPF
jgi:hypothetical protein